MTLERPHARIAELIDALEQAHREMMDVVTVIPPETREAPARDGAWSIAQHIEHLTLVEDSSGRLISRLIKQVVEADARESDDSSVLGSLDQFHLWTTTTPFNAPEIVQPREGLSSADALARLLTARQRTIAALQKASGLALGTVSFPHPVIGPIDGYQWALMIAQHQRRHTEHIRRLSGLDDA